MVEPLSIATASIGFAFSVLGALAGTLSGLNTKKRSILDFRDRIHTLVGNLGHCQSDITMIQTSWAYSGLSGAPDMELYRKVWGEQYDDIKAAQVKVSVSAEKLKKYVREFLGLKEVSENEYMQNAPYRGRTYLFFKRVRFGLFSETTLNDMLKYLRDDIQNLKKLGDTRLNALIGEGPDAKLSGVAFKRICRLAMFGQAVWDLQRGAMVLELWPPGWESSMHIDDWNTMDSAHMCVSFAQDREGNDYEAHGSCRYKLSFDLNKESTPVHWTAGIVNSNDGRQSLQDGNPVIDGTGSPFSKAGGTFRDIFEGEAGKELSKIEGRASTAWNRHIPDLLVALTTYYGLFLDTEWTQNICTSGIRYVEVDQPSNSSIFGVPLQLHTLGLRPDHIPARPEEDQNPAHCYHGGRELRLKSLGLVLAEIICASPFRLGGHGGTVYEAWKAGVWRPVLADDILAAVQRKCRKKDVKRAVRFCLKETVQSDLKGIATLLERYRKEVVEPFLKWSDVRLDNLSELDSYLPWGNDAPSATGGKPDQPRSAGAENNITDKEPLGEDMALDLHAEVCFNADGEPTSPQAPEEGDAHSSENMEPEMPLEGFSDELDGMASKESSTAAGGAVAIPPSTRDEKIRNSQGDGGTIPPGVSDTREQVMARNLGAHGQNAVVGIDVGPVGPIGLVGPVGPVGEGVSNHRAVLSSPSIRPSRRRLTN